jgi:hypothetical protein
MIADAIYITDGETRRPAWFDGHILLTGQRCPRGLRLGPNLRTIADAVGPFDPGVIG